MTRRTKPGRAAVEVVCEQMFYTWAGRTVTASGHGFGILCKSSGWPSSADWASRAKWFSEYLPQGATRFLSGGLSPPDSFARYLTPEGVVVAAKTYLGADGMGRPGNYLVHAILDRTFTITSAHALSLGVAGLLRRVLPEPATPCSDMSPLVVKLPPRSEVPIELLSDDLLVAEEVLQLGLQGLLTGQRLGEPLVLITKQQTKSLPVIAQLASLLPPPLAANLTFSSYERDPRRRGLDLAVTVPPFTSLRTPVDHAAWLDLDSLQSSVRDHAGEEHDIATALVRARRAGGLVDVESVSQDVTQFAELPQVARLLSELNGPPAGLSGAGVSAVLDSPAGPGWLRRKANQQAVMHHVAAEAGQGQSVTLAALLRLCESGMLDPRSSQADGLINQAAARAVEAIVQGSPGPAGAFLAVLRALGVPPVEVDRRVVQTATDRLKERRLQRVHALLWEHVSGHISDLQVHDLRLWLAAAGTADLLITAPWSRATEMLVRDFLQGDATANDRAVGSILSRCAVEFAAVLADVIVSRPEGQGNDGLMTALVRLRDFADQRLLVKMALDANVPAADVVNHLIGNRLLSDAQVRTWLRDTWAAVCPALGLHGRLVTMLKPEQPPQMTPTPAVRSRVWPRGKGSRR